MAKEYEEKIGGSNGSIETIEDTIEEVTGEKEIIEENDAVINSSENNFQSNNNDNFIEENELNEGSIKKSNTKKIVIGAVSLVVLIAVGVATYWGVKANNLVQSYQDKVYPEVYVLDTDVSGMTKDELTQTLDSMLTDYSDDEIKVTIGDKEFQITKGDLDLSVNFQPLVDEILNYGKDNKFLDKLSLIQEPQKKDYDFTLAYSEEGISEFVQSIAEQVYVAPSNASIYINGGTPQVTAGQIGNELNSEKLISDIKTVVNDINGGDTISLTGEMKEVNPEITTESLQSVNGIISSYTTNFSAGPSGTNIQIGATKIDNSLLMPGQKFSTVEGIGPTTAEYGFVPANTYVDGKVVPGYGGGVCQIATTLYNAELRAGIVPLERQCHMMTVGYAPLGLDATIGDYAPDLLFENPYDYPIVIKAYTSGGSLTVEFWSNTNATNGITYEPKAYASGLYAEAYLYGYDANGNLVSEQFLNTSTYQPFSN